MILKSISFCEHSTGWNVNNLDIETLSLLVGASGVGKTKILRSILCLSKIASGQSFNGVEWRVMFSCNNNDCLWAGQFENKTEDRLSDFEKEFQSYSIIWEKLFVGGREIVRRENDELYFNNEKTVKT